MCHHLTPVKSTHFNQLFRAQTIIDNMNLPGKKYYYDWLITQTNSMHEMKTSDNFRSYISWIELNHNYHSKEDQKLILLEETSHFVSVQGFSFMKQHRQININILTTRQ